MCYQIDVHAVRAKASGRWDYILRCLAPQLKHAAEKAGHHVACPCHGGEDGFRLFKNFAVNGSGVCNTCGNFRDGFALLEWVNGWSFRETLEAVAKVLGMEHSCDFQVLDEVPCRRQFVGKILGFEDRDHRFIVRFTDEKTGEVRNLFYLSLRGPVIAAGLMVGDRVRLTQVSRQKVRMTETGKEFHHMIWNVEKLPTPDDERRQTVEMQERDQRFAQAIDACWQASKPLTDVPAVGRYLSLRGLSELPSDVLKDLRALPLGKCLDDGIQKSFPMMVAAVRDGLGRLVTLHRTFLSSDGHKAPVSAPKRISALPSDRTIVGCAVRLGNPVEKLAVAEGIETALSVVKATGVPCWSCLSAHGLETVEIPEGVEEVFIFADKDRSETGQKAAENLRKRLLKQGIFCAVFLPGNEILESTKGVDWNDVLMTEGKTAFPSIRMNE